MIKAPSSATAEDIKRFQQEAEAAARLNHSNIVEVYEAGNYEGWPYFTMRFIEGARTCESELGGEKVDPHRAAGIISTIARAAHYAHQHGVIHRDIKPGNILIDPEGVAHLTDFGLAKLQGELLHRIPDEGKATDDRNFMGTPAYMSPEQAQGRGLTVSTDIYALGTILYELLAGHPPFRADNLGDLLRQVIEDRPKPLRSNGKKIPPDLEAICMKCLSKQESDRYRSAAELADDLDRGES